MPTTQWLTTVKRDLAVLQGSSITIGVIAKNMLVFYMAAHQKIPSPSKIEQTPQSAMESVIHLMVERASKWLEAEGDKLPHDEFSMQYGNLFLAANHDTLSIYYQNGFAIPLGEASKLDKNVENKIVLARS